MYTSPTLDVLLWQKRRYIMYSWTSERRRNFDVGLTALLLWWQFLWSMDIVASYMYLSVLCLAFYVGMGHGERLIGNADYDIDLHNMYRGLRMYRPVPGNMVWS